MVKPNTVKLVIPAKNREAEFEIEHAERILRVQNNGGWQLPSDSKFEFDFEHGLKRNKIKRGIAETEE